MKVLIGSIILALCAFTAWLILQGYKPKGDTMISTTTTRVAHACNGSDTIFTYAFKVFEDSDLVVTLTDSTGAVQTLVLDTDYTVTGAGDDSGGTVITGETYASGYTLTVYRAVPLKQEVDLSPSDPLPAETLEGALDRVTMFAQQLGDTIDNLDQVTALPRSYLAGLKLSNGTDADHDIDIAVGTCRDSGNAANITIATALTKQLDAAWAAGTGAGGLDTGSIAANAWYYVWMIRNATTEAVDALFSTSSSAPTMPTGYTQKRRIGAVKTDSSANIKAFIQEGDHFRWTTPAREAATILGTTMVELTVNVPPAMEGLFNVQYGYADAFAYAVIYDGDITEQDPSASLKALAVVTSSTAGYGFTQIRARTKTTESKIKADGSVASQILNIVSLGWWDRRGQDD